MSWIIKSKNTEATSILKSRNTVATSVLETKIPQSGLDLEILTPDYQQILVCDPQDEVLIYQAAFNNWDLKVKILT